jgi:hypothetical protein
MCISTYIYIYIYLYRYVYIPHVGGSNECVEIHVSTNSIEMKRGCVESCEEVKTEVEAAGRGERII